MDQQRKIIIIIFLVFLFSTFLYIKIGSKILKWYFNIYLKGSRTRILKNEIPEMNYYPTKSELKYDTFLLREPSPLFLSGQRERYYSLTKHLGSMSFNGKYHDIHIEDAWISKNVIKKANKGKSKGKEDRFERILIYCDIPSDSILNELKHVKYFKKDTIRHDMRTGLNNILNGISKRFSKDDPVQIDVGNPYNNFEYTLEDNNTTMQFENNIDREQWSYYLNNGLGKKINKIISTYGTYGFRCLENKFIIVIESPITYQDNNYIFYEDNDYFIYNLGKICNAVKDLYSLLRWADVSNDDTIDSSSNVDKCCEDEKNGKKRFYPAERKPKDMMKILIYASIILVFIEILLLYKPITNLLQ